MQEASAYCDDFVKSADEDLWLAARYADALARRKLLAISALRCEIRRIPSLVSEATLGEIRLRWWRDGLAEILTGATPRAHPVLDELCAAGVADKEAITALDSALNEFSYSLYGEPFSNVAELSNWLAKTEGLFDEAALRAIGAGEVDDSLIAQGSSLFFLARNGNQFAPHLKAEIADLISRQYQDIRPQLSSIDAQGLPAIIQFALTSDYERGAIKFPLLKRYRLFTAYAFSKF